MNWSTGYLIALLFVSLIFIDFTFRFNRKLFGIFNIPFCLTKYRKFAKKYRGFYYDEIRSLYFMAKIETKRKRNLIVKNSVYNKICGIHIWIWRRRYFHKGKKTESVESDIADNTILYAFQNHIRLIMREVKYKYFAKHKENRYKKFSEYKQKSNEEIVKMLSLIANYIIYDFDELNDENEKYVYKKRTYLSIITEYQQSIIGGDDTSLFCLGAITCKSGITKDVVLEMLKLGCNADGKFFSEHEIDVFSRSFQLVDQNHIPAYFAKKRIPWWGVKADLIRSLARILPSREPKNIKAALSFFLSKGKIIKPGIDSQIKKASDTEFSHPELGQLFSSIK